MKVTKWMVAKVLLVCIMLFCSYILGGIVVYQPAFNMGVKEGYLKSFNEVKHLLGEQGITFSWKDKGNGDYSLSVLMEGQHIARISVTIHLWVEHWRDGKLLSQEYGAGVATTQGLNWIEQQLSGTLNSSQHALYLSDSNNSTDPPLAAWTVLPNEITTNGLDRQTGAYTSTGNGAWNVTVTKTATGTQSTQLWGINYDSTDGSAYLLAADSGPSQKNLVANDTLKETWQVTVT